jgi:hypothetical protein
VLCGPIFAQISLNKLIAYFAAVYLFCIKTSYNTKVGLSATVQNFLPLFHYTTTYKNTIYFMCSYTGTLCIVCWMIHPPLPSSQLPFPLNAHVKSPLHVKLICRRRPWCGSSISSLINFRSRVMVREGVYPLTAVPMSKPTLALVSIS